MNLSELSYTAGAVDDSTINIVVIILIIIIILCVVWFQIKPATAGRNLVPNPSGWVAGWCRPNASTSDAAAVRTVARRDHQRSAFGHWRSSRRSGRWHSRSAVQLRGVRRHSRSEAEPGTPHDQRSSEPWSTVGHERHYRVPESAALVVLQCFPEPFLTYYPKSQPDVGSLPPSSPYHVWTIFFHKNAQLRGNKWWTMIVNFNATVVIN